MQSTFVITLSCPDRIGIVADVAKFLVDHRCNIIESAQFSDPDNGNFFMRTAFQPTIETSLETLESNFAPIIAHYGMDAHLFGLRERVRTVILVSRFGHCLNDLLFRWSIGALPIDIRAVASNHLDFADAAGNAHLPFHHLPITPATKAAQEQELLKIIGESGAELIILARYMQVLSPELCARFPGRIINIHHSFLPSFKGARPYHQAHQRGVKFIGATAHYVTENLDEGPIIEQDVERMQHSQSIQDFIDAGRDIESLVLARAVKWHAERRVLLNGSRTVIFR